jgi:hypothetical protein
LRIYEYLHYIIVETYDCFYYIELENHGVLALYRINNRCCVGLQESVQVMLFDPGGGRGGGPLVFF